MKKVFILALVIRLICLYLFRNVTNYDLQSYLQVGELTLKGINIYPDIADFHHPYLPFFLYIEAFALYLGRLEGLGELGVIIIIKFINIIFDLGIVYLVYLLSQKSLKKAFLYAINPVTTIIITLHGQFDVIPLFFLLFSLYLIKVKKQMLSILVFSFAIMIKTWPLLFIVGIYRKLRDKKLICFAAFFPILSVIIYRILFKTTIFDILETILGYQGLWGIWGPWAWIGQTRIYLQKTATIFFLISFFVFSWINRKKRLIKNIYELLIFFFIFTTNFSIQYFAWLIPFLILVRPKKYFNLIFLICIYLFSFYLIWLYNPKGENIQELIITLQNIVGFVLWISFTKIWYLSK